MSGTVGGTRRKVFTVRAWNSHSAVDFWKTLASVIWILQVIPDVRPPEAQLCVFVTDTYWTKVCCCTAIQEFPLLVRVI